jgi:cytochrome P450
LSRLAGSDTTSISLTFCFWELSQRADILKKLHAELDEVMIDPRVIPNISVLQKLPYMNAFIKEGVLVFPRVDSDKFSVISRSSYVRPSRYTFGACRPLHI